MGITSIFARQILDSRGNPTVEVDVRLADASFGRAAAPSGASTGAREALERRDGGQAFGGKGVAGAITAINTEIAPSLLGKEWTQETLDKHLQQLDGTDNFSRLGANAVLPLSLAFAVASAQQARLPVYRWIGELTGNKEFRLPRPLWNIMNGGAHANWTTDIQEYMVQATNPEQSFAEQVRMATEIFHTLGKVLNDHSLSTQVGNEGGYAPDLPGNTQALDLILEAIQRAGYKAGLDGDVHLALDVAASELYKNELYHLPRDQRNLSPAEMQNWIVKLLQTYPIFSIEDPFADTDWRNWSTFMEKFGSTRQIVGDDLLATNPIFVQKGVAEKACNALIVKPNQIGTLTQTLQAMQLAQTAGWRNIPSHRSGETEDVFIAHLAVGTSAGQIKTGAPSRTDRTAKYNELIRISETL